MSSFLFFYGILFYVPVEFPSIFKIITAYKNLLFSVSAETEDKWREIRLITHVCFDRDLKDPPTRTALQTDISLPSPFSDLKVLSRISLQNSRNILRGSHRMLITHMSPWVIFFYICPAGNILKTNLTKFVVIWSEKASIGMFLWIRSKITLTKEKEMRKWSH